MYSLITKSRTKEFISKYGKGIAQAIQGTNLFFATVVAQKALESNYGESGLTKEANNFGGIKYNPNLEGVVGYVVKDTTEYIKGKKVAVQQKFSKFRDVQSGVAATIEVLKKDRYANARNKATTPQEQVLMIAQAGYTTTPPAKYLSLLKGIIEATQDLTGIGRVS